MKSTGLQAAQALAWPRSCDPSPVKALICEAVREACGRRYGQRMRALILTGSMARDEATLIPQGDGCRLLGDAEFLLFFHDRERVPSHAEAQGLGREIEGDLARRGVLGHVGLSASTGRYLRRMQPHIFAYELRVHGQIVCGDQDILSLIPDFSPTDIPLEDAWRLLCNRMIEHLETLVDTDVIDEVLPRELRYRTVKLYLDMGTSLLVFLGAYKPSYRARARELCALAQTMAADAQLPFPLPEFAVRVNACTTWKLSPADDDDAATWDLWRRATEEAHRLWRWELARLTGLGPATSDERLCKRWMQLQSPAARFRGWLHAARERGWLRGWRDWPRWASLAWRGSPRYWVYAVAAELFFQASSLMAGSRSETGSGLTWERLRRRLPIRSPRANGTWPAWRALAREIAVNYQQLLMQTRS